MKNFSLFTLLIAISLLGLGLGCQDNEAEFAFSDQVNQLEFKILTLDEEEVKRSTFSHGVDVNIAVQLTNTSSREFVWNYDYTCHLFQTEEFLVVYKNNESDETSVAGTPYQSPINCPAINLPSQKILPGGSILLIKLPWSSNPNNQLLSVGKYSIKANIDLKVKGHHRTFQVSTDFEIK